MLKEHGASWARRGGDRRMDYGDDGYAIVLRTCSFKSNQPIVAHFIRSSLETYGNPPDNVTLVRIAGE